MIIIIHHILLQLVDITINGEITIDLLGLEVLQLLLLKLMLADIDQAQLMDIMKVIHLLLEIEIGLQFRMMTYGEILLELALKRMLLQTQEYCQLTDKPEM